MDNCNEKPSAGGCLDCPSENRKRFFDCSKYFGSDHLKFKRLKKFECKNKRIRLLAQPKYFTQKYVQCEEQPVKKSIEISREVNLSTRIQMLSVPKVRKLVASYDQYKCFVANEKLNNINQLIGHSMMTMYSRLANVHLTDTRVRRRKWTKADWKRHCEWLKQRACPKKVPKPNELPKKILPLEELEVSIYKLSQPRHPREKHRPNYGYESPVKDACKLYVPTKRIIQLAVPKKGPKQEDDEEDEDGETETFYANQNALKYNATSRIQELARPKTQHFPKKPLILPELTPFGVVKRALKASLSERTLELAKPKVKDDDDDEEKPLVNPKALKAKPTPRILELAKPRVIPE